jgi:nucleoside-diphosphate-sugar epimerase
MKILITGATGVIGRRLVPLLCQAGHDVAAAARSPHGRADVERHGATAVDVDLFDLQSVGRAVAGRDAVINLATHMPVSSVQMLLPWAWRENDRIRRIASRTLVEASLAGKVSRFIQESFAPVYPDCGDRWIDDGTPIRPARATARSRMPKPLPIISHDSGALASSCDSDRSMDRMRGI